MAIVQDDDKLQQDPNQIAQQQGAPGISQGGTVSAGQSSQDVGGGVSTAGVGAGGTGGWTNIQAYLDANKGDTGSAQALEKQVGGQFDAEKNAYTQDSAKVLGEAKKQVDANNYDNARADEALGQAGTLYQYGGAAPQKTAPLSYAGTGTATYAKATPGPTGGSGVEGTAPAKLAAPEDGVGYQDIVGKMQHALTDTYSGPNSYSYGFGNQTQQLGNDLNDNQGFDALMKHVYQGAAPGSLNSGQTELQKQLDVNNVGLVNKRKELQQKYADLGTDRDSVVQNTTASLGNLANQYGVNQNALKTYLTGKQGSLNQTIGDQENQARAAFGTDASTLNTGWNSGAWGEGTAADHGWTANDLENLMRVNPLYRTALNSDGSGGVEPFRAPARALQPTLDNFYSTENQKYGGTADSEKKQFNALLDFLNQTEGKKNQAFTVK